MVRVKEVVSKKTKWNTLKRLDKVQLLKIKNCD